MMINTVRSMLTCRWAARRIQRYLDSDPAAALPAAEVDRLEAHLAECARCSGRAEEYRALGQALREWSNLHAPDPHRVTRLYETAERIASQEPA